MIGRILGGNISRSGGEHEKLATLLRELGREL
jgi:hypothetical protein